MMLIIQPKNYIKELPTMYVPPYLNLILCSTHRTKMRTLLGRDPCLSLWLSVTSNCTTVAAQHQHTCGALLPLLTALGPVGTRQLEKYPVKIAGFQYSICKCNAQCRNRDDEKVLKMLQM